MDAISEEIVSTCKWYAPGFAGMRPEPGRAFGIGHQLPGVAAACRLMVEAHRSAMREQPWLRMIGWDAMIARGGPPVFFEGNYAQVRVSAAVRGTGTRKVRVRVRARVRVRVRVRARVIGQARALASPLSRCARRGASS